MSSVEFMVLVFSKEEKCLDGGIKYSQLQCVDSFTAPVAAGQRALDD